MERFTRRRMLAAVGLGLGTAGCLSDEPGRSPTDSDPGGSPTDPGDGTPTDTPTSAPDGGVEYEVVPLGTSLARLDWRIDDSRSGHVELYASEAATRGSLALDSVPDRHREDVESFVDATDFESERLLSVASIGPNTCHSTVEVTDLSVADDALVGAARAVDTSDPGEGCGDAITYPSALVRVRFEDRPRDRARLTITDGWDEKTEVTAAAYDTDPRSLPGHVRPEGGPAVVPDALDCDEAGFTRHPAGFSGHAPWGESADDWGAFALRVDRLEAERGDEVTVTLTNVGTGEAYTGNRHKYNLQVHTDAGWQDVRGSAGSDSLGYTDEAVGHDPGEGFEWPFQLTPEGVLAGHAHEGALEVCPGLPAGRYRFVFWEPTLAVAFDLVE